MSAENIRKIFFLGNILRFSEHKPYKSNQNDNIAWIAYNLQPIFQHWLNISTNMILWDEDSEIDVPSIYGAYDLSLSTQDFAQLIEERSNETVLECFSNFDAETLVVGFEMPRLFLDAFEHLGIPFIDLMIGPIRFLPDLQIGIRTNRKEWFQKILEERQMDNEIHYHAGSLRARVSRLPKIACPKDSLLVVGQVTDDVSLVKDGAYIDFPQVAAVLRNLAAEWSHILFKPHPYASGDQIGDQVAFLKSIGDVCVTDENIYRLILSESVEKVVALTSSVVIESQFLGKNSEFLSQYPFRVVKTSGFDPTAYIMTHNKVLKPSFWSRVLDRPCEPDPVPEAVGRLRDTLGRSWGYSFDQEHQHKGARFWEWIYGHLIGKKGKTLVSRLTKH